MTLKLKLVSAATQYDARQSRTRFYNPNALGIYLGRIDEVCRDIEAGMNPRTAIMCGFNDRLLTVMLKAAGLADFTAQEAQAAPMTYTPKNHYPGRSTDDRQTAGMEV